jgi:hypothetical protein
MLSENVLLKEGFSQVLLIQGVDAPPSAEAFEELVGEALNGARIQYLEQVLTNPSKDEDGFIIQGTGGRSDLLFSVHSDDVGAISILRLQFGMRWIEDVIKYNDNAHLYPARLDGYCRW